MSRFAIIGIAAAILAQGMSMRAIAVEPATVQIDIPAQSLADSIQAVARQTNTNILVNPSLVAGRKAPAINQQMSLDQALSKLLEGTGLKSEFVDEKTIVVAAETNTAHLADARALRLAQAESPSPSPSPSQGEGASNADEDRRGRDRVVEKTAPDSSKNTERERSEEYETSKAGIPEVLVSGSKVLNTDIKRNGDDAQPYVVLDRKAIASSGATTLGDFFKLQLTMNSISTTQTQTPNAAPFSAVGSSINLRGVGAEQTLILIDGHRVPDANLGFGVGQPDINNIPLTAIDRVEVLATTSSGIYGGSATGGVVNVILRRDYAGAELQVNYQNTVDSGSPIRRVDFGAGFNLGEKTNVLVAMAYSDSDFLLTQDRDVVQNAIARIRANNPNTQTLFGGPPPVGATPNIRAVNGVNLVLKNGTALNSPITHIPVGYAGIADGGAALAANAGQYNFDLSNDAQVFGRGFQGGRASLTNASKLEAVMTTIRTEVTPGLEAFLELAASNSTGRVPVGVTSSLGTIYTLAPTTPNNPFQQAVQVAVPFPYVDDEYVGLNKSRRLVGGALLRLPGEWRGGADFTWHRYDVGSRTRHGGSALTSAANGAIAGGTLDIMRDVNRYPIDLTGYLDDLFVIDSLKSTLKSFALRASGPFGSLPAGRPQIAALLERRDTSMPDSDQLNPALGLYNHYPSRTQVVDSAYVEARVPLLAAQDPSTAWSQIELQIAGRWDDYTTEGGANANGIPIGTPPPALARGTNKVNSFNPTIALRYQPVEAVALRMSYGTGFQPPTLNQLAQTVTNRGAGTEVDPRRGGTLTPAFVAISGGNPSLGPEKSESWSVGTIFTPRSLFGLRLSMDYTHIQKRDNIAGATSNIFQGLIDAEALNPGRVTRGPNLPGDLPGWAGPIMVLDFGLLNIAKAELDAVDLHLNYRQETRFGAFDFFTAATRTLHYKTQLNTALDEVENVGISRANPLKLRANAGVDWSFGNWSAGWIAYYYDSYLASRTATVILDQGNGGYVESQTYHDVNFSYRFDGFADAMLRGTEVRLGVKNVFDKDPPLDAATFGSLYSTFGDARGASYYIALKKVLGN